MVDLDSERIWKIVESYRLNVPRRQGQSDGSLSLFDHLHDCYVECRQTASDKSADKRFRSAVNLLERLSPNHAHPSLIVNLYSDEQGYSLVLSPKKGSETEEIFLPYEDNRIFSYLDNQELPPVLVEVLLKTKYCHMYNGCVVCEVRDHRSFSCSPGNYDRHLLLLRPTTETILSTVEEVAYETGCSAEEKLLLESQLLLATQPPICLEPSTDVVCFSNRLQYNQRKFHTPAIRRALRKRSHARRARMHMTSVGVAPRGLQLHDFITQRTKAQPQDRKRDFSNSWKKQKIDHHLEDTPETILASVHQLAKPVTPPPLLERPPQLRRPSTTSQSRPHPQAVSRQPSAIHPLLDEREVQSVAGGVQNDIVQLQGNPPPHPSLLPHHVTPPSAPEQHVQHQPHPLDHAHPHRSPLQPHPVTPVAPPPPVISPPPPISTSITPSQPHPLTPTHVHPPVPLHVPPPATMVPVQVQPNVHVQASANVPMSATPTPPLSLSQAPPSLQALPPPSHAVTSQPQPPLFNLNSLQRPPGVGPTPEILKLILAQHQAAQAAQASVRKPRPIVPAVVKTTTAGGGVSADKLKPPALVSKPPPLTQGSSNAVVVIPRSRGSSQVHVRPQLNPLSIPPTPPTLTPSPKKRPPLSQLSQPISLGQGGMPKLHPLSHEAPPPGPKSSLPPQPVLNKPIVVQPPPPLSSSASSAVVGGGAPLTMPTLHKITATAAMLPSQQKQQQQLQKATPIVGGVIPTPPLRPNPNVAVAMPKLSSSIGGQVRPLTSTLPMLSRAPAPLHPAPPPKPHPQTTVGGMQTSGSSNSGGGAAVEQKRQLPISSGHATVTPSKKASPATAGSKFKSHKHGSSSSGKVGKSQGSKKKKK